jgi:hypothetical protein
MNLNQAGIGVLVLTDSQLQARQPDSATQFP